MLPHGFIRDLISLQLIAARIHAARHEMHIEPHQDWPQLLIDAEVVMVGSASGDQSGDLAYHRLHWHVIEEVFERSRVRAAARSRISEVSCPTSGA